jgi:hypothetical protein
LVFLGPWLQYSWRTDAAFLLWCKRRCCRRKPAIVENAPPLVMDWPRTVRACFMVLFLAYPGISFKTLSLFRCSKIDGNWYLTADMRLRCYDAQWFGIAGYAAVMTVVYILGLPFSILYLLMKRRRMLFGAGPSAESTRERYGFLYVAYGQTAWWWEVEELLRKLILTSIVLLFEAGSALQVTVAVLVSGWAHVLHAVFKPWGAGSVMYALQHGSLFVTTFVFLMGLLFKANSISRSSGVGEALSVMMLVLCVGFLLAWAVSVIVAVRTAKDPKFALFRKLGTFSMARVVSLRHGWDSPTVNPLWKAKRQPIGTRRRRQQIAAGAAKAYLTPTDSKPDSAENVELKV